MLNTQDYLKILVEDIHSTVVATIDRYGHPVTRCIDMMLYDDNGVFFLTAKGKEFYTQLMEQRYISLSAISGSGVFPWREAWKTSAGKNLMRSFLRMPICRTFIREIRGQLSKYSGSVRLKEISLISAIRDM
ncbi:MAG: hypothetical protein LKI32_06310 [Lachnospiraceae bacterium]|nr:hypothetical protein [Lachnospiraceae bacterium]MCI1657152.1 hypothetical protein [Lachnospiraceae bacterium]MCI2195631.1 hypothetical protein [Lachnospiraceae bacterium]